MEQSDQESPRGGRQETDPNVAREIRAENAGKRSGKHHRFEFDVDDSSRFRNELTYGRKQQRSSKADGRNKEQWNERIVHGVTTSDRSTSFTGGDCLVCPLSRASRARRRRFCIWRIPKAMST